MDERKEAEEQLEDLAYWLLTEGEDGEQIERIATDWFDADLETFPHSPEVIGRAIITVLGVHFPATLFAAVPRFDLPTESETK